MIPISDAAESLLEFPERMHFAITSALDSRAPRKWEKISRAVSVAMPNPDNSRPHQSSVITLRGDGDLQSLGVNAIPTAYHEGLQKERPLHVGTICARASEESPADSPHAWENNFVSH